jgi:SAM-dependent methyltransferase
MESRARNEFEVNPFVVHYEEISDTFINIKDVARSLKQHIPPGSLIFELGLGTGYFAAQFLGDGYSVCGIQPPDEMLPKLKRSYPGVRIVAEARLEDFHFPDRYDTIVSHSSVFLFTRHPLPFGPSGEVVESLVLQSFIKDESLVDENLAKILQALRPGGKLFVNIQSNPLPRVEVGPPEDRLVFEMTRCLYHLDLYRVEKNFRVTWRDHIYHVDDDRSCFPFSEFRNRLVQAGGRFRVTDDWLWVIIERRDGSPE